MMCVVNYIYGHKCFPVRNVWFQNEDLSSRKYLTYCENCEVAENFRFRLDNKGTTVYPLGHLTRKL